MTLTIFEDAAGLWVADEGESRGVSAGRSTVDIAVVDGMGNVLDGSLLVNGTPFAVERGKCKIRTEALHRVGYSTVAFVAASGVKRECHSVRQFGEGALYFPSPREAMTEGDIILLLRKLERLREKLESAKALCSDGVSGVLGI